jgi:hypothetical protein
MSDARLFPGWDTMLWLNPPVMGECWGSTTPGYLGEDVPAEPRSRSAIREQCREYSTIADGLFLEVIDGAIVAEWWRGGRFAVREAYP